MVVCSTHMGNAVSCCVSSVAGSYGHVRCGPVNVVCLFCVVALWMQYVCYGVDSQLRVDF